MVIVFCSFMQNVIDRMSKRLEFPLVVNMYAKFQFRLVVNMYAKFHTFSIIEVEFASVKIEAVL